MMKGLIYSIAILIAAFLMMTLLEYFGHYGQTMRAILFYGYILSTSLVIFIFILVPGAKLLKLGKIITHEQAAVIISSHFSEIGDQLINALQLAAIGTRDDCDAQFLQAAIEQKTRNIQHIPFNAAIDPKENTRKLPLALIPAAILLLLFILAPTFIKEPARRIAQYSTHFEKPMPFSFNLLNEKLEAMQGDDIELKIEIQGNQLPAEVYITSTSGPLKALKSSINKFSYRFRNVQKSFYFKLEAGGYRSRQFSVSVYPKPVIVSYTVTLDYPAYTGRPNEQLVNTGDFTVPEGTRILWEFSVKACDSIVFSQAPENSVKKIPARNEVFAFNSTAQKPFSYVVKPINIHSINADSLIHFVGVIADQYPEIQIEGYDDPNNTRMRYFTGIIRDDYGFEKLLFHYIKRNLDDPDLVTENNTMEVKIDKKLAAQTFYHNADFSDIELNPGDRIEFWFEIWDNDQVNGSKAARTGVGMIEIPGMEQMEQMANQQRDDLGKEAAKLFAEIQKVQNEINKLQKNILEKESIGWEESQRLQKLLEKQQELQQAVNQLSTGNKKLNQMQQEYRAYDEDIIRKQLDIQKLFDEIMTDDMKKMIEELQKMLQEMNKDNMLDALRNMRTSNEELSKSLDRTLELFKQLELEKIIKETADKLGELSKNQKDVLRDTQNKESENQQLINKQTDINREFENVKESLQQMDRKNNELDDPNSLMDTKGQQDKIDQSLNESLKQLQKKSPSQAAPNQKEAADQMEKLGGDLMDMLTEMQNEQLGEDIQMLRKLLENLVDISFDQENLMNTTLKTNPVDPRFVGLLNMQNKLKEDLRLVEDSLQALAKRQISIETFVLREIAQINLNVREAISSLENRSLNVAAAKQQFVMTSVNNLALMLAEAMQKMNDQMASSSAGKGGSCPRPGMGGKGKPSMSNMRDLQQQLNQQMQNLKQQMQQGQQSPGGRQISEQFARMAAQQEALRRQLQSYMDDLKSETGKDDSGIRETLKEMERTEQDLVNKRLSNETLTRQQRIETRLLESEKALLEREKEQRRESTEARDYPQNAPDSILEMFRQKMKEREMLRTVPPQFNSYYRGKTNEYFLKLQ